MTSNIGSTAYAKYGIIPTLSYNAISYLINNNELIWKLLFYNTPEAWNETNLTND